MDTEDEHEHLCLRWNAFESSVASAFDQLRCDEQFLDVTLVAEGQLIKAHRLVLSACSPLLRRLLAQTSPCSSPVVVLNEMRAVHVHALLEFMYRGQISVARHELADLLRAAEALRVRGLTDHVAAASGGGEAEQEPVNDKEDEEEEEMRKPPPLIDTRLRRQYCVVGVSSVGARSSECGRLDDVRSGDISAVTVDGQAVSSPGTSSSSAAGFSGKNSAGTRNNRRSGECFSSPDSKPVTTACSSLQSRSTELELNSSYSGGASCVVKSEKVEFCSTDYDDVTDTMSGGDICRPVIGVLPHSDLAASNSDNLASDAEIASVSAPCSSSVSTCFAAVASSSGSYPCPFCNKSYASWGFRRRHVKAVHARTGAGLSCKWCRQRLASPGAWSRHVTRRHGVAVKDAEKWLDVLHEASRVLQHCHLAPR